MSDRSSRGKRISANLAMIAAMTMSMTGGKKSFDDILHIPSQKHYDPWSKIQLTKSERKGKTPEEINEMRKKIWEEQNARR